MSDQNDHGEGWQILDQVQMSAFHALYPGREVVVLGLQVTAVRIGPTVPISARVYRMASKIHRLAQ